MLVVLLTLLPVSSQSTDSLRDQLEEVDGAEKVEILLKRSKQSTSENLTERIHYGRQALDLARSLDYEEGIIASLEELSSIYRFNNELSQALPYKLELLNLYRKNNDKDKEAAALLAIGNIYKGLGDHARALEHLLQGLRIYEDMGKNYRKALVQHSIARVYTDQQQDSLAQHAYRQSLQLLEAEEEPDYSRLAIVATTFAEYFEDAGQFDSALTYYNRALSFSEQINSPYNSHAITMALLGISSLYESEEAHAKALDYNRQAYDLAVEHDNATLLGLTHKNQAGILRNMGELRASNRYYQQADSFFQLVKADKERIWMLNAQAKNYLNLGDHSRAAAHAKQAWQLIRKAQLPDLAKESLPLLVTIYEEASQFDSALHYQKVYQSVRDTLLNEESADQIAKLRALYETEKKEKEIMELRNTARKNQILLLLLTGGVVAVLIIAYLLYRQQRLRRMKARAEHELQQHQLQSELKVKQQELTTYTLKFVQKNQLLEQLREKIHLARKEADDRAKPVLNEVDRVIRSSFRLDHEWDEFQHYFEQVHPRFFNTLKNKYPHLSNKELRLCALLKLNLSSKEIATLLGISPSSVKMARHRLRKKLGLPGNEDLVAFMIDIESDASAQKDVTR